MLITDADLRKNKYSKDILIENICNLSNKLIIRTQILDYDFCVNYMLNEEYHESVEESYFITVDFILKYQPHLKVEFGRSL